MKEYNSHKTHGSYKSIYKNHWNCKPLSTEHFYCTQRISLLMFKKSKPTKISAEVISCVSKSNSCTKVHRALRPHITVTTAVQTQQQQ